MQNNYVDQYKIIAMETATVAVGSPCVLYAHHTHLVPGNNQSSNWPSKF